MYVSIEQIKIWNGQRINLALINEIVYNSLPETSTHPEHIYHIL